MKSLQERKVYLIMSIACSIVDDIKDEESIIRSISRAFTLSRIPLRKADSIMIKPNLCYYWDASTGETTSPKLIGALIEYLRGRLRNDPEIIIGEADASAMKTKHAFRMLGYEELARKKEVKLLNLSSEPSIDCQTSVGMTNISLPFSKMLLENKLLINVPKLKYHRLTRITCAMKNIFGAIAKPRKFSYHSDLTRTIVAANKIVSSNIVLVDGLVALGAHPKIMKTLLLSQNAFTVDYVSSRIIGFNPGQVQYLKLAMKEHLGKIDYEIVGDASLEELEEYFPMVNYWRQRLLWGLQLKMVNLYTKITGDITPPMLLE